ncbi:class I SAM-dependent methyltransferase [Cellulomonas oligotrophica]|uniref:class I SAM-dependent methyltransferase n=1 Tax=Cellulomonas oligotrophica TaxID=931536 RepID=UPI0023B29322|nr:class I SAM-dependent methyltransferase [Cellulomonas oligotrophica]
MLRRAGRRVGRGRCPPDPRGLLRLPGRRRQDRRLHGDHRERPAHGRRPVRGAGNLGAQRAVGVDISPRLVEVATATAQQVGVGAEFVCSDVLDYHLDGPGADLVYTGKGALHWMFDLKGWAATVARTLAPGGWLLVFDFHPMMWLFRDGEQGLERNPVSYFAPTISYTDWAASHFAGGGTAPTGDVTKRIRPWPPSAVVQALVGQGLELQVFHEYPDTLSGGWTAYPRATDAERAGVATTYAVMACKPDGSR